MSDSLERYPDPKYDVFIAHNNLDGDQVDELVQKLESRGVRVCHPGRDFFPGKLVTENMASAIAQSRKTATFLTKNFLGSARCKQERAMAETKGIKSDENVLVDILVDIDKDQLPDWLLVTTYVEINSPHFFTSLLTALEVSCAKVRVKKTYDDLVKENDSLWDDNKLLMKQNQEWEEKRQSWLSEKHTLLEENQALTSKLIQLKQKQSVHKENDNSQKEQVKRRRLKGLFLRKRKQKPNVKEHEIPAHWLPITVGKTWEEVLLSPTTKEYLEVLQRFWRTTAAQGGWIGGIFRIQNPSLYNAYQTKKSELSQDMPEEYTLYYGTSRWGEYEKISERGFSGNNEDNNNSAGNCFTSTSQAAIQNSSTKQHKFIIVAKVLLGRCIQSKMVTSGQDVPAGYDSVVDNMDNPSWVRIKDANHAYPEYMIIY